MELLLLLLLKSKVKKVRGPKMQNFLPIFFFPCSCHPPPRHYLFLLFFLHSSHLFLSFLLIQSSNQHPPALPAIRSTPAEAASSNGKDSSCSGEAGQSLGGALIGFPAISKHFRWSNLEARGPGFINF